MVKWYNRLYLDKGCEKRTERLKKTVEAKKLSFQLYCIAIASNPENLFDIMDCNELLFGYYKRKTIYIVGLAKSREGAVDLLVKLLEDINKTHRELPLRQYFLPLEEKFRC